MTNNFKDFDLIKINPNYTGEYNNNELIMYGLNLNLLKLSPYFISRLNDGILFYISFDQYGNPYAHQTKPSFESYRFIAKIPTNGDNLLTHYSKEIRLAYEDIIRNKNYGSGYNNPIKSPPKSFKLSDIAPLTENNKPNKPNNQVNKPNNQVNKPNNEVNKPNKPNNEVNNSLIDNFNIEEMGVGGMNEQLKVIFQNVFASRILHEDAKKMNIEPVRGILLYGPPGCGKTLIARNISKMIKSKSFKYVSGPEIKGKFVGSSEENIRKLFKDAEEDKKNNIPGIHVIVFDEFDSIGGNRENNTESGSNVDTSIVNQLLTKIDGVDSLDNILMIALTNRKNALDPALLRPGRFETHIEITLPDFNGRKDIFNIYLKKLENSGYLSDDIDIDLLSELTNSFSGAEIKSVVNSTCNRKLSSKINMTTLAIDKEQIKIKNSDFIETINETVPQMAESLTQVNNISLETITSEEIEKANEITEKIKSSLKIPNSSSSVNGFIVNGKSSSLNRITGKITKELLQDIKYVSFISPEYYMESGKTLWKLFEITKNFESSLFIVNCIDTILGYDPRSIHELKIILNSIIPPDKHVFVIITSTEESSEQLNKIKKNLSNKEDN